MPFKKIRIHFPKGFMEELFLPLKKIRFKLPKGFLRRFTQSFTQAFTQCTAHDYIYAGVNILACFVFCALVLVLGKSASAFLWATNSVSVDGVTIAAADIRLELTGSTDKLIRNFKTSAAGAQSDLIDAIGSLTGQAAIDEYFAKWYLDNLDNDYFEHTDLAVQYSILQRGYTFKNASQIPVYFRISRAVVSNGMDIALAAYWSNDSGTTLNIFDYDEASGFYYLKFPLSIDQEISVTFVAMILDASGGGDSFDFSPGFAEIIQAVNSAVFMADGWRNFADKLLYVAPISGSDDDSDIDDDTDMDNDTDSDMDNDTDIDTDMDNDSDSDNDTDTDTDDDNGNGNGNGNNGGTNNGGTNNGGTNNGNGNNGGTNNGGTNNGGTNNGGTNNGGTNNGNANNGDDEDDK